jgi:hypothetical protein
VVKRADPRKVESGLVKGSCKGVGSPRGRCQDARGPSCLIAAEARLGVGGEAGDDI